VHRNSDSPIVAFPVICVLHSKQRFNRGAHSERRFKIKRLSLIIEDMDDSVYVISRETCHP